jgi:membrane fusion protein (multidrug efflux system)
MNKPRPGVWIVAVVAVVVAVVLFVVLKPKGGEEEETAVDMAVHAATVTRATLHRFITAYGAVMPEPAASGRAPADAEVASPVAGIVAHIDCVEGQRVAKGAILFRLDSRVAEVALDKARKAQVYAEANFDRQSKLLPVEGTSKKAYDEAKQQLNAAQADTAAAETDLALLRIQAPLDGTIVQVNSEPGEAVELNTILAKIVDLGRLVAAVSVPSGEAGSLKTGQSALLDTGAASGVVVYVGGQVDDKTGTVPVRVSVPPSAGFRPGQFLSVRIISERRQDCLTVPEKAVVADTVGGSTGWIVLVAGDKAVRKPVTIGLREGGLVEVAAEGLKEGQAIVSEDAYAVPAEPTTIHIIK